MALSYAETASFTCPECSYVFPFKVWILVAADERPDLIERIRAGALHTLTCPQCGQTFDGLDAPLLIFRPATELPIIFSPAQQTTNEQDQQQAADLMGMLRERLGTQWRGAWLAQRLPGVHRAMLPVVLALFDPQTRQAMEEEPGTTDTSEPIATTAVPQVAQALDAFTQARSWIDSYHQIQAHPELLSDTAMVLLEQGITAAEAVDNANAVAVFTEYRDLLHRCHEIGVDAAFTEKLGVPVEQLRS